MRGVLPRDRLFDIGAGHDAAGRAEQLEREYHGREMSSWRAILSLGLLRQAWPRLWTPPLVTPAVIVPRPAPGAVALTFVGHSTMMMTGSDVRLLVDPLFENWLGLLHRARAATLHAADLADVGLVLISNANADRLSRRSLARLPATATVVVPGGCGARLAGMDFARVVELSVGNALTLDGVEVSAVPAHPWKRHPGTCGYVVRCQRRVVYFAGETGYFGGFSTIGARHAPEVAILPIGGYQPASFRRRRLSPLDAIYAFEDLRAKQFIPVAFGSFALGYEPLDEPATWLGELIRQRHLESAVTILGHGQTSMLRR
jgi:L-ascorbate metabolism protein UlaG (beta-lactamase superfamily)